MKRQTVLTDNAPKAIGPYSQAVIADGSRFVFCSGQIPMVPATGQLVEGGIRRQTLRTLRNLRTVLEAAGSDLARTIKITVYLKNMEDYSAFNEAYEELIGSDPPARAVIEAARLPKDALVEMDAVAVI